MLDASQKSSAPCITNETLENPYLLHGNEHGSGSRDLSGSPWNEWRGTPAKRLPPEQLQGLRKQPGLILDAALEGAVWKCAYAVPLAMTEVRKAESGQ